MVSPTLLGGLVASAAALFPLAQAAKAAKAPNAAVPKRPEIKAGPFQPSRPFPASSPRTKACAVKPLGNGADDSANILQAFKDCNNGGAVVLDQTYTICNPLDLTFLNSIDVALTGTVSFCDDIDHWLPLTLKYKFQNASAMWAFGGKDVNIYGDGVGTLQGNGQKWYDRFATNPTLRRPTLFVTDGLEGGSVTGLKMVNSPMWFNLIANSKDVLISDIDIKVASTSSNTAKNTDGWDIYRSDNIVIQNSRINNGDDCVSFKPNSTNIVIQGLDCFGAPHGISVGSLGQYLNTFDIVENVYVYNTSMSNASDGARIKVWPGINTVFQPSLSGGGGSGYVKNVTYDTFHHQNNDNAITIDQCYGQKNQAICDKYPSNLIIRDIYFKNHDGVTSQKFDPRVGSLVCSSKDKCLNIQAENINVKPPSGKPAQWLCVNLALPNINCVSAVANS